jgi:predicted transcriptional regulator
MMLDNETKPTKPSRADVETLLILMAVGTDGCGSHELANRLGLGRSVAAVAAGLLPLVNAGLIDRTEDDRVALTEAGRGLLARRLDELEVSRHAAW